MEPGVNEEEDKDVERLEWTPNAEQFARYLRRERQMAVWNLRLSRGGQTLHSLLTLAAVAS